ncbi:MAG TPA: hypothetical protein VMS31_23065 [Pyrinomonadaceae bacterium]|nr:hypothetical protein [Pyrinomonadaceae bacterium]
MNQLDRWELLAAETYSYSYDNYADHRGNLRFDQYMPEDVRVLDRAIRESWPLDRIAKKLERSKEEANLLLSAFRDALEVVDAPTPAESFRRSTRQAIKRALAEGIESESQIEALVVQICYRAADLSFLLRFRNEPLHKYSDLLRREPGVEYHDGGA